MDRPGVEPGAALVDQIGYDIAGKSSAMLLPELELRLHAALVNHADNLLRRKGHIGKPRSALDAAYAEISAQVEVGRQLALSNGDLERPPAGDSGHATTPGGP